MNWRLDRTRRVIEEMREEDRRADEILLFTKVADMIRKADEIEEADVSMQTDVDEAVRATNAIIAANNPAPEPREQHPFEATTQQLVTELRQAAATLLNEAQRVSSETDAICDNLVAGMKKKAMEIASHTDRVTKLRHQMNAVIDEYQGHAKTVDGESYAEMADKTARYK